MEPSPLLLAHLPPIELESVVCQAGLVTCRHLMKQRGIHEMGLLIPLSDEPENFLTGLFPDEVIQKLGDGEKFHFDGTTMSLLNKAEALPEAPFLIFALGVPPTSIQNWVDNKNVKGIVFVPQTRGDIDEYLSIHPQSQAIVLRPDPLPVPDLTAESVQGLEWFNERYVVLTSESFGPKSKQRYLTTLSDNQICRYCERGEPEVSFKKKAHAFPEQIGNKALIDRAECDSCNEHFSKWIEDDFAKWTLPIRSMGRINGKGIPTLKSRDGSFRIDAEGPHLLKIQLGLEDPRHQLHEEDSTITLELERQPYVPMGVFKCMVKMALAVMPEPEASLCKHLKDWILLEEHSIESYPYQPLKIYRQLIPGPLPNDTFHYLLLRRHPDRSDCPFMIFVLQFSNMSYQIILPMHKEDEEIIKAGKFSLSFYPHIFGTKIHEEKYGKTTRKVEDMSSTEVVKGEHETMSFHYDQRIEQLVSPDGSLD